jgi:hypothetical protein
MNTRDHKLTKCALSDLGPTFAQAEEAISGERTAGGPYPVASAWASVSMQRGKNCQICGRFGPAVADHCHATGAVRDWLCVSCNAGLGMFRDDPEALREAARYLERHKAAPRRPEDFVRDELRRVSWRQEQRRAAKVLESNERILA